MDNAARLFVVSAPSGTGKTTLCARVLRRVPGMVRSVSATTRARRQGERNGVDYFFITPQRFARQLARGDFLEHAVVFGHAYGTPRRSIEKALRCGRDVLLSIDVQGAMQVRRKFAEQSVFIFIVPPSAAVLRQRLRARGTDSARHIRERLSAAQKEMRYLPRYDYRLVNDDKERASKTLAAIITAERCRISRRKR